MNYNPIYVKNLQRLAQIYYLEGTMEEIRNEEEPSPLDKFNSPKSNFLQKCLEIYQALEKLQGLTSKEKSQMKEVDQLIKKRNEEMKNEMFSQLKSLGNMCLNPF